MSHLGSRSHRHSLAPRTPAGATAARNASCSSALDGRLSVARALVCGLLCALALVVLQSARPESAHAAKLTTGWVTGTVYFSKGETAAITEGGPGVIAVCGTFVPGPYKAVCLTAVAWTIQANRARNRGMCLKVKFVLVSPGTHWPDIYRGGYCR